MPIHGKTGGAWETVTEPSAKAGGTWRDGGSTTDGVEAVYVKVGGAWRMAWPLKVSVAAEVLNDTNLGGTAAATLDLQADGQLKKYGDNTSATYTDWADNAPDTDKAGAADTLFQYKWEAGSGTLDTTPVAASTWTDLGATAPVWELEQTTPGGADKSADITLHIRSKDATDSEISFTVNFNTFTFGL